MNNRNALISLALELNNKFKNTLDVLKYVNSLNSNCESGDNDDIIVTTLSSAGDVIIRTKYFVERVVNSYTRNRFQQNFRMEIDVYELLLTDVSRVYKERYPNYTALSIDKQLLAFIWILANRESYRSVADRFDMAKSTLSWSFFRIVNILNMLAPSFIKWPNRDEMERIQDAFYSRKNIRGIIGVIDGTYRSVPFSLSHSYTNRKKFTSITLQGICDDKMMFIDCFVGYPSSVHDARIFRNSPIHERTIADMDNFFPTNYKILGDKAYPCLPWCIPPYKDFGRLTDVQKHFNRAHASTRQIIERTFALFFGRFRRFHHLEMKDIKNIPSTILAGCVLHNACLRYPEDLEIINQYIEDGTSHATRNATEYGRYNTDASSEGKRERDRMAAELGRF